MRVPVENDGDFDFLQDEIVSLAEDIIDTNEKLDDVIDIEQGICDNCIKLCDIVRDEHERVKNIRDRVMYIEEDVEDKSITLKIIFAILTSLFLVWNLILTYHICYGIK